MPVSVAAIDPALFRQTLGHYPTGVAAVTALDEAGVPLALVVGSFTSVSLDPPLVGFLPDKRSTTWPLIHSAGHFAVNILGSDQTALCRQLAGKGEKMAGVAWHVSEQSAHSGRCAGVDRMPHRLGA
jgi:flavin reductase (DIM6/NTAB) family NADH-FMN oxidoreductase RutF